MDHADVVALRTASGMPVELMRTWYRTQVFPRHSHDYFTLGVVLRGAGTLWYRGLERTLQRGDVVVIPPGEVHTGGMGPGSEVLSYLAVHVPPDVFATCVGGEIGRAATTPDFGTPIIRDRGVSTALRRLDTALRYADDDAADDALSGAIALLVRRHANSPPAPRVATPTQEPGIVRLTREVIEECYAENERTSLHALALLAGVTPFHLVRVFTQTTGLSPHRYLVQTRVRRASQLLARGVPSSLAAAMTGFVDQSHLITQFKRYVGTTPASYQRCIASGAMR
ncbi:MAG: AraC family transcriptional regulator [bacterium]